MSGAGAVMVVVLVGTLAADAAADPDEKKRGRIVRLELGPSYFVADGEDAEAGDPAQEELSYSGLVGSITLTGAQLLNPYIAIHGEAFAEIGAPRCVQHDFRDDCVGESGPILGAIGGGFTAGTRRPGLFAALTGWGGTLRLDDPEDVGPDLVPWFGFDVAIGAEKRLDRHWSLCVTARSRLGFTTDSDDFRSFTSMSIAMSFARR